MASNIKWNGKQFLLSVNADSDKKLHQIGILVQNRAKEGLSKRGRSSPGEWPGLQTGALRNDVKYQVSGKTVRIGTSKKYGLYLEKGTKRMAARPWLSRAWRESQSAIKAIATKPMETTPESAASSTPKLSVPESQAGAEAQVRRGGGGGGGGGASGKKKKKKKHKR